MKIFIILVIIMVSPIKITRAGTFLSHHIPFNLGFAGAAPQVPKLIYWVEVEKSGRRVAGVASEFAMVGWFDKGNSDENYLRAMTHTAGYAVDTVQNYYNGNPFRPFRTAKERGDQFRDIASSLGTTRLALQMVEALEGRAILDALSRAENQNAVDFIIRHGGFDLHEMDDGIAGVPIESILHSSSQAPSYLFFRHTVGLDDHISEADAKSGEQSLEGDIKKYGINRFKIKIDKRVERSIDRLCKMAEVIESSIGNNYIVTLDGNESFDSWDDLLTFADRFTTSPKLRNMVRNTSYIEQPFCRDNLKRIDGTGRSAIEKLKTKYGFSILIDESGDEHDSYRFAIEQGITGGGFKLCKGVYKAIFDAAVALSHGEGYFNSAEDLTVAEPTDLPQAIDFFGAMKVVPDAELNGAFKTKSGTWMTQDERELASIHLPSLFRLDGETLKVIVNGNKYPRKDVGGIGLGSPVVCFDPEADAPDLRRKIRFAG